MSNINATSNNAALSGAMQAQTAIALEQAKEAASAKAAPNAKDIAKADAAAKDFESVFVSEMLKPMFEGIKTDGEFGGGKGEEVFRDMMLDEYGKMITKTGSIGLADQVKQQMILMQEQANNGSQKAY